MTTTVKATGPANFLSLVPVMLGYQPEKSIIIVAFENARSKGVMRFDIPPAGIEHNVASTIIGLVAKVPGVTAFVPVIYTDTPALEPTNIAMIEALDEHGHNAGLHLSDKAIIGSDGWVGLFDEMREVHPLAELERTDDTGLPVREGGQMAGTELPGVSPEFAAEVDSSYESLKSAVEGLFGEAKPERVDESALATILLLDDLVDFYEMSLNETPEVLSASHVAALVWCFERPALRDVGMLQFTRGVEAGEAGLEAQLAWEQGTEYPAELAQSMWGEGPQPDAARLERALFLVRAVAAAAPIDKRAGALSVAAWLSWSLGRSTHAQHYADLALGIDSQHGLAEIVRSFVDAGHLPEWAFKKPGE